MKKLLLSGSCLYAFILLLNVFRDQHAEEIDKFYNATVYSNHPVGLSSFFGFLKERDFQTEIRKRAFLEPLEVDNSLIFIASPNRPVSRAEAGFLKDYMESGGSLWVSFHNQSHLAQLGPLFDVIELKVRTKRNPYYQASAAEARKSPKQLQNGLIQEDIRYAYYSNIVFDSEGCDRNKIECFILGQDIGKGRIYVTAGFAPMSNGLIRQEDNEKYVAQLMSQYRHFIFDEYHHFFDEATLGDLFSDPKFIFPILGFIIICLLALFYSDFTQRDPEAYESPKPRRQWHELIVGLIHSKQKNPKIQDDALKLQSRFLLRRFPELKDELERIKMETRVKPIQRYKELKELEHKARHERQGVNL